jgi:hypothetical protein
MVHHLRPIPARSKLPDMRTLTSGAADADGVPLPPLAAGPRRRSGLGSVAPALGGLAAAAALTVAAFFGVGLVLLTGRPPGWSHAPPAVETQPAVAVSHSVVVGSAAAPAVHGTQPANRRDSALAATGGPPPAPPAPEPAATGAAPPSAAAVAGQATSRPAAGIAGAAPEAATPSPTAPAKPPSVKEPATKPDSATIEPSVAPQMSTPLSAIEISTLLAQGDEAFREGDLS